MNICFPVQQNEGTASTVYNHFGSAPFFLVVDTDTNGITAVTNGDQHHTHGQCNPLKAIDGQKIDVVVVGGIGAGALSKLNQLGIKVHRAEAETVAENLALFTRNSLPLIALQGCCGGHGSKGGCAH